MGLESISQFHSKYWIRLLKYSFGSRLINSVPKGIRLTYDFVLKLQRKNILIKKEGSFLCFEFLINGKNYTFSLAQDSSDTQVFDQIIFNEEYRVIIDDLERKNILIKTMIDAGANIGLTSIYFKAYYPDLKIIALEPSKGTFERLSLNIQSNNFSEVILLQKGLWNKVTRLKEDLTFRDGQDWSFRLVESNETHLALFETTSIPVLMSEYNMDIVDFLKVDIEGGEKDIFDSKSDLSWLNKIKVIAIEIHDEFNCRTQIETTLVNAGFELSFSGELTIGLNTTLCNQLL
jgi:FkbM family methyltransferase